MAERDTQGRFIKGNQVAVGNKGGRPRRSIEEKYLARLAQNVDDEDFDAMIRSAVTMARDEGDTAALRLLLQYLIGMPTQYVKQDVEANVNLVVVNWDDGTNNPD